jgi:hypothetical protein
VKILKGKIVYKHSLLQKQGKLKNKKHFILSAILVKLQYLVLGKKNENGIE